MKVQLKTFVAVLLTALLAFGSGCGKDPENGDDNNGNENGGNNNGGNNNGGNSGGGTAEGMYVGIIGFNDVLKTMPIGLLNSSTEGGFTSFIGSLTMDDNTALYHATNTALDWLQSATLPTDLINVSLLTFTDGLDNASLMLNGNYDTQAEFLDAVNGRIMNDRVQGKSINAYSIGLKGNNVTDEEDFRQKLRKLASSNDNFYLADNMDLVMQRFKEIANQLYNEITIVNTNVKIPGGYDNNTTLRLTFDNVSNANSSTCYIQAVFSREDGKGKLSNINYYGLQSTTGDGTFSSSQEGASYWYTFSDLKTSGADAQPMSNLENMRLWIFNSSTAGWRPEDEFTPSNYTNVSVTQKSAVAVLVLDCTTSLGETDFGKIKDAAMEFITTLNDNSGNGGGGNNGGGNGGNASGNTPTVTTASITDITTNSAKSGGVVTNDGGSSVTERGICWSTSHEPTTNNNHVNCGSGTGAFSGEMVDLAENTVYYVRAYATNSVGTSYGEEKSFQTEETIPIYTIEVLANPSDFGEANGGGEYERGEQCTVTAIVQYGYSFINWTEGGSVVSSEESYTFTVNGNRSLIANFDHEYVDLGLPSGTLWATCNVGANTLEGYGDRFSWGENDPATANWGDGWCKPTKEQWKELWENTTNRWTTQNDVNGRLFIASNGNSLFLPAAGRRYDDVFEHVGSIGYYWSSSPYLDYPGGGYYFYFTSNSCGLSNGESYGGLSVRAVRSVRQN